MTDREINKFIDDVYASRGIIGAMPFSEDELDGLQDQSELFKGA